MYKISTYFYWLIIILIRGNIAIIYGILRTFRYPVLKLAERIFYRKCLVKIVYLESDENIFNFAEKQSEMESQGKNIINLYVKDKNLLLRIISEGSLALGEGLLREQIYCNSIEELTLRALNALGNRANPLFKLRDWVYLHATEFPWDNDNNTSEAKNMETGPKWLKEQTRELLLESMGNNYNFISGYWDTENMTIESALNRNMELISQKLDLKPGMLVLDLGCGTGIFAKYLATYYDVNVIGINLSEEEIEIGSKSIAKEHPNVHLIAGDYKSLLNNKDYVGKFDRVVSIHLIEHLGGPKEYDNYFRTIKQYLKPGGKCFIQVICNLKPIPLRVDLFTRKYFLGNQVTPYLTEILTGITKQKQILDSNNSFGSNYSKTYRKYLEILNEFKKIQLDVDSNTNVHMKRFLPCLELGLRIIPVLIEAKIIDVFQIFVSSESKL